MSQFPGYLCLCEKPCCTSLHCQSQTRPQAAARDEQEPHIGRGIFGSRNPAGTPEPGSYWSLSGRTGEQRRARWLLLVPVTAERPTLTSLLRVQGTQSQLWSTRRQGSPHTQALKPLPVTTVQGLRAAVWSLTAAPALGAKLASPQRNH